MGITGESVVLNYWESDCDKAGWDQHWNPGRLNSYLQGLSGIPKQCFCSFAESSQWHNMIKDLAGYRFASFRQSVRQGGLPALEAGTLMPKS